MLNAISGQNLPVLNFAYHLPKQWFDQYANVDGKQPKFFFYLSYTALYFYKNKSSSRILSSISLFQAYRCALLIWTPLPRFVSFFFSSSIFRPHSTIWTPVTGYSSIRIVSAIFISLFSISKNSQLESAVSVPFAVSVTRNLSAVGCLLRWVMPTTEQGKSRNINNFVYVNYNEALFTNS